MSVATVKKETATKWLEEFELTAANRLGASNGAVKTKQEKAIKDFAVIGVPNKKLEDFKYTNVSLYLNDEYTTRPASTKLRQSDVRKSFIGSHSVIVMVNGRFVKELSNLKNLPKEVTVKNLFTVLKESTQMDAMHFNGQLEDKDNPLVMLNTAMAYDGIYINIPAGYECKEPIQLLHVSSGNNKSLYNPRNVIKVGEGASFTLIESYQSVELTEKVFTNSVTEITVEKDAIMNDYILQNENELAYQNNVHQVTVGSAGKFNSVTVSLSGGMIRNDLNVAINGENCEIHMHGLFMPKDGQHIDNHTLVEHNVPNCYSNELYKGIISDGGTGVFNGKIFVNQDAQKTNAYQSNKNVLLGDKATINTKPQLEIYADDVKCSHGTTTGMLDQDALFYLQTRGLNETLAKKILLGAFTQEISDNVIDDAFRKYIEGKIQSHIA